MKKILFNPFEQFPERPLILLGIAATIILSMTSAYFNARFDGILDLHFSSPTYLHQTLLDNALNIAVLSLILFILGKFRNGKTRFIDIFTASLIARIPYYLLPFFNWNDIILNESDKLLQQFVTLKPGTIPEFEPYSMVVLGLSALVSLLFLFWYLYLLYKGYKIATNAKGVSEIVWFSGTILVAEIISKIIFSLLN